MNSKFIFAFKTVSYKEMLRAISAEIQSRWGDQRDGEQYYEYSQSRWENKHGVDFSICDADISAFADMFVSGKEIDILTCWSGYLYKFYGEGDHLVMEFEGPRRAVGRQNLLPDAVKRLVKDANPWGSLVTAELDGEKLSPEEFFLRYANKGWHVSPTYGWDGWWELDPAFRKSPAE